MLGLTLQEIVSFPKPVLLLDTSHYQCIRVPIILYLYQN